MLNDSEHSSLVGELKTFTSPLLFWSPLFKIIVLLHDSTLSFDSYCWLLLCILLYITGPKMQLFKSFSIVGVGCLHPVLWRLWLSFTVLSVYLSSTTFFFFKEYCCIAYAPVLDLLSFLRVRLACFSSSFSPTNTVTWVQQLTFRAINFWNYQSKMAHLGNKEHLAVTYCNVKINVCKPKGWFS